MTPPAVVEKNRGAGGNPRRSKQFVALVRRAAFRRALERRLRKRVRRIQKAVRRTTKRLRLQRRQEQARFTVARAKELRYRPTYARSLSSVPSRLEIPHVLNARGLFGRGVEVGVQAGRYSDHILRRWEGELLISADPWRAAPMGEYPDTANVPQAEHDRRYAATRERLAPHGTRSAIWRCSSVEAAAAIPQASLDFVYLDARHDYVSVAEDLGAWLPTIRPGGIFAGHDYFDGHHKAALFEVKRAVDQFFGALGLAVHVTFGVPRTEMFPSWLVEIPR